MPIIRGQAVDAASVPDAMRTAPIVDADINSAAAITASKIAGTALVATALDTDSTFAANSDTVIATQKAVKTALALKANLASPALTGTPTFAGSTSGTTGLKASATASGTLTLPAGTDTLVGQATTDTLTNKTLTAPVVNSPTGLGIPQFAVVASDVTHAQSDTTLSNVTGLTFTIGASSTEIWFFELYLEVNAASTTPDVKFGWATAPTSATMRWGFLSTVVAGTAGYVTTSVGNTPGGLSGFVNTVAIGLTSGTVGASFAGKVYGAGTGGAVQFQFAQNTSDPSDVKVLKGSMLRFTKLVA